jgi:hypothetical protein
MGPCCSQKVLVACWVVYLLLLSLGVVSVHCFKMLLIGFLEPKVAAK